MTTSHARSSRHYTYADSNSVPLRFRRSTTLIVCATTTLITILAAGCSSSTTPRAPATTNASGPTAPPHLSADNFSGPILEHCATQSKSTTIGKMNVETGELVDIATFPIACSSGGGQISRLGFSQDYHKAALPDNASTGHATYYDSDTKSVVDVTNIVAPPSTGDFGNQERPDHRNGQFDDQGLFVFYDAKADAFDYFDTTTKKVARTTKTYIPQYIQSIVDDPTNVPTEGRLPNAEHYRLCSPWFWVIDDTRYLREVNDGNNHYLVTDTKPAPGSTQPCDSSTGQRITPPSTEITDAAADPNGKTIVFMVFNKNNIKAWDLYRANPTDPAHPTPITMAGNILQRAGYDGGQVVSILDWK